MANSAKQKRCMKVMCGKNSSLIGHQRRED